MELLQADGVGVFPAQAGMILLSTVMFCSTRCFPRSGGDDPLGAEVGGVLAKFSPLRRG